MKTLFIILSLCFLQGTPIRQFKRELSPIGANYPPTVNVPPIYRSPSNPASNEGYEDNGIGWIWFDSSGTWFWNKNNWYPGQTPINWYHNDSDGTLIGNHNGGFQYSEYSRDQKYNNYQGSFNEWLWDQSHPDAQGDYPWNHTPSVLPLETDGESIRYLLVLLLGFFLYKKYRSVKN